MFLLWLLVVAAKKLTKIHVSIPICINTFLDSKKNYKVKKKVKSQAVVWAGVFCFKEGGQDRTLSVVLNI